MTRLLRWTSYILIFFLLILAIAYGAAQYYQPRILAAINQELKKGINGDVQIGDLDFTIFNQFPSLSVALSDVYLRGPRYNTYHKDFFKADRIYVRLLWRGLFTGTVSLKSITIKNADIFIFRTKDGYGNLEVFRKHPKTDSAKSRGGGIALDLAKVVFDNTTVTYSDSLKGKSYGIHFIKTILGMDRTDSAMLVSLDGPMHFGGLVFNSAKGGYLTNVPTTAKLRLAFASEKHLLTILPSELGFTKSMVNLSGYFDLTAPGGFALSITSPQMDYAEGLSLVTPVLASKLSKFQFERPVKLSVSLLGSLAPGLEPKIDLAFSTAGNHFTAGKITVEDLAFEGTFINHVDTTLDFNDNNSRIHLTSFKGNVAGFPTDAAITITDLKDPRLDLDLKSLMDLTTLNHASDTTRLQFLGGTYEAKVKYNGRLKEYLDPATTSYEGKLEGSVKVHEASAELVSKQKKFEHVNVGIRFTEKQMDLDTVMFLINGSPVEVKGNVTGFIPFFFAPKEKGHVYLSVYSHKLDLSKLIKKKNKDKARVAKSSAKSKKRISDMIDMFNDKVEFAVDLKVDEVVSGPFRATKLAGKVGLANNQFRAGPVTMNMAGGTVMLTLKMTELDKPVNPVSIKAEVKNADLKTFFRSFNNFSQSAVKSENVEGKVSTKVTLDAQVDEQFNVLMPTIDGKVDFVMREGRLQDFEPMQKMSNFLFKNRDFKDVEFAEIKSHFDISGPTLDITRMEIQSSVITLFLEGKYSMADSTDLSIQVPLSNLKKRDGTYKPENVGTDAKVGASVFLRARKGKDGKMSIAYDPLKKLRKKKKA